MLKRNYVTTVMVALLALTMSACASISGRMSAPWQPEFQPQPVVALQVELPTPELKIPEIAIKERNIPLLTGLSGQARIVMSEKEIRCMANVLYFEARGEGTRGMTAVGYVVLNRMGSPQFKPQTVCGVVYDQNRRGCQFSWVCDGVADKVRNWQAYERARQIAVSVMTREADNPIGNSIYFRHRNSKSRYAWSQRLVASVGQHRFFVERH